MGRKAPARLVLPVTRGAARPTTTTRPHTDPALQPKGQHPRGFAADKERARAAGQRGGKRGQAKGTAHRWTTEEARAAGALRGDPGLGKGKRRRGSAAARHTH